MPNPITRASFFRRCGAALAGAVVAREAVAEPTIHFKPTKAAIEAQEWIEFQGLRVDSHQDVILPNGRLVYMNATNIPMNTKRG